MLLFTINLAGNISTEYKPATNLQLTNILNKIIGFSIIKQGNIYTIYTYKVTKLQSNLITLNTALDTLIMSNSNSYFIVLP